MQKNKLVVKQHALTFNTVAVAAMHLCHLAQYVHYSDGLWRGSQSIMHLRLT